MWFTLILTGQHWLTLTWTSPYLLLSPGTQALPGGCFKAWFSCLATCSHPLNAQGHRTVRMSDPLGQRVNSRFSQGTASQDRWAWAALEPVFSPCRTSGKLGQGSTGLKPRKIHRRLLRTLLPKEFWIMNEGNKNSIYKKKREREREKLN
jgi:hypothetical protein